MARTKGSMSVSANFEVKAASPVDARYMVNTLTDLTDTASWVQGGMAYVYMGMQVFVRNEKKLYMLMSNNFTQMANWKEISSSTMTDALVYRGTVATRTYLPTTGMVTGDTYYITDETLNVYYDGTNWVDFGSTGKSSYLWKSNTQLTTLATPVTISLTDLTRADNGTITATALDMIIGKTIVYSDNGTVGIVTGLSGTTDVIITPVVQDTKSDGVHLTSTTLSKTIGSITSVTGMTITDLVINETLLYDNDGTIAVVTAESSGTLTATTISTSGEKSDGVYVTTDTLDTIIGNTTTVNLTDITGITASEIVIGETQIYDTDGTVGIITAKTTTDVTVTTITNTGEKSDGTYDTSDTLDTTIGNTTTISVSNISGASISNFVVGETLIYDGDGTVGKVVSIDTTNNEVDVETITISGGGSDGTYPTSATLSTTIGTTTSVNLTDITGITISNIILKETQIYDTEGTVGIVTAITPATGTPTAVTVTTITKAGGSGTSGDGVCIDATLLLADWDANNEQTVTFTGYSASMNGVIGMPTSATTVEKAEYSKCEIDVIAQSGDQFTVKAKVKPTMDLPVTLYAGGGSGDANLTEDITSNTTCGAAPANTFFPKGMSFTDFAKTILIKEIAPSINVTATNSGVYVVNTQISGTTINLKINSLGTSTPTSIEFYIDGILIDTQAYTAGKMNYSTDYSTVITSATPKTVTATAKLIYNKSDGNTANVLGNKTIVFVYPSFSGITSLDSTTITEADIKAMTKLALTSKFYTASGITMSNQRTIFVYPQTYGNLTTIKDDNNFEYLQSYDKTTITIDGVLCNAYILHDSVTVTNFKQIYN